MLRLSTRDEFAEIAVDDKKREKFVNDLALNMHNETSSLQYSSLDGLNVEDQRYWRSLALIVLRHLM